MTLEGVAAVLAYTRELRRNASKSADLAKAESAVDLALLNLELVTAMS